MIIPLTVIGFGTGCIVWGSQKVFADENVDQQVFEAVSGSASSALSGVSEALASCVLTTTLHPDGTLEVEVKPDAPSSAEEEISEQAQANGDVQAVDVYRST